MSGFVHRAGRRCVAFSVACWAAWLSAQALPLPVPESPKALKGTLSMASLEALLTQLPKGLATVTVEGHSAGKRPLYLVRLCRNPQKATFRALLLAQQHGNEVSGKDALLCLIREYTQYPERFPEDLDLYVFPTLNPDGLVSGERRNAAKADLNRDHLRLEQPETRVLYAVARRLRPHLAVDGHEFTRDSKDYTDQGWLEWPLITLDGLNHPLIPAALRELGLRRVAEAAPVMKAKDIAYTRYLVGGVPPLEELRPSTLEPDDARNGLGSLGTLSFIIEAGIQRRLPDPQIDLPQRATAFSELYKFLLGTPESRRETRERVETARQAPLPSFIPTNTFWVNGTGEPQAIKVIERSSGRTVEIPSALVLTQMAIKRFVPTPVGYVVEARAAAPFKALLDRHGLRYEVLAEAKTLRAEGCRLLRVEEAQDALYERYAGRQIIERDAAKSQSFPAGSLRISLSQEDARRAIQVLEPCQLYGLFQYPEFRALAGATPLPIWREVK